MFQLKLHLERLRVSQTHDSLAATASSVATSITSKSDDAEAYKTVLEGAGADEDEDITVDKNGICNGKPETGNRTVKACFGCKRTHNEQLCIGSCGVILGRATFYGSEALNGVRIHHSLQLLKILIVNDFIADILANTVPNEGFPSACLMA